MHEATLCGNLSGAPEGARAAGEAAVVETEFATGRDGRNRIRLREFGDSWLPWSHAAVAWGAEVDTVICQTEQARAHAKRIYPTTRLLSVSEAVATEPHNHWRGVLAGVVRGRKWAYRFRSLLTHWHPTIALVALHGKHSRGVIGKWLTGPPRGYVFSCVTIRHWDLGGATEAIWKIASYTRTAEGRRHHAVEIKPCPYPRTLEMATDDTLRAPTLKSGAMALSALNTEAKAPTCQGLRIVGTLPSEGNQQVADGRGLAWDFSAGEGVRSTQDYWVRVPSVYFGHLGVVRKLSRKEILALWDYPSHEDPNNDVIQIEHDALVKTRGPPGKIIRAALFSVFAWISRNNEEMVGAVKPQEKSRTEMNTSGGSRSRLEVQVDSRHLKAAKEDDAPIDKSLWAVPGETESEARARETLRRFFHLWWVKNLDREARAWVSARGNCRQDSRAVRDCLTRASLSTWWEWSDGSRLFFWRWREWSRDARDGIKFWHRTDPVPWFGRNLPAGSAEAESKLRAKETTLWYRRYLERGYVRMMVSRFGVKKGDSDVRCVWDSKRNGHNDTLWAPGFRMPTFRNLANLVVKRLPGSLRDYLDGKNPEQEGNTYAGPRHTFQSDMDIGEMFLNYPMHYTERCDFGARLTNERPGLDDVEFIRRFSRLFFGCKCSPYAAVQACTRGLEIIKGRHDDPGNPYQWSEIRLNLPCSKIYDPSLPRVLKVRTDGDMASDSLVYMDDGRSAGAGRENCRETSRRLSSMVNYLGEQDASRKRRPESLVPGAWSGKLLHCNNPYPVKSVPREKWDDLKQGLDWIIATAEVDDHLDTVGLRRVAGKGMSQTEVYSDLRPYYRSFFNALEAWRGDRDLEGWRLARAEEEAALMAEESADDRIVLGDYPREVRLTRSLLRDAKVLREFYEQEDPIIQLVRPRDKGDLSYIAGDASGDGFGAGTQDAAGHVRAQHGLWLTEEAGRGSNWREARNLANRVLRDVRAGRMDGHEVWMATDNSTWSAVINKGMSTSEQLYDVVREVKEECRRHDVFLHCFHVSGLRMISSGFDGLSRGDFESGVMLGADLRDFLPLHKGAFEVAGDTLEPWVKSWMGPEWSHILEPAGWFGEGHRAGCHVWAPAPAAALDALEQLSESRLKRPYEMKHVVLIPRLLYNEEWRRRFEKEMDFWFTMSPGEHWPNTCLEPLLVGISFPMRREEPWLVRRNGQMVGLGRKLSSLSKNGNLGLWNHLRELWTSPWGIP